MKQNIFNSVKMTKPGKSSFDLSHDVKLSCNMGELVPVCCVESIPGDKFNIGCESLIRFAPLVAPVMHRMDVTIHYFFVPLRLLWTNWEKYITNGGSEPLEFPLDPLPSFPTIEIEAANYTRLADFLGIPTPIGAESEVVSAMPFAAYQKIWNEYYRDQNLIESFNDELIDGDNPIAELASIQLRAWEHDYFTSALPFAQKGNAVSLPIGAFSDVKVFMDDLSADTDWVSGVGTLVPSANPANMTVPLQTPTSLSIPVWQPFADTSSLNVTQSSINDLRAAYRLQEWLEKNARGGTRYIENILAHFGVRSSDKRLQRPEYITGVKSPVVISEVLNTTGTEDAPQGEMAGHGVSVVSGEYGNYYAEEHGYIIGIMSIMPKTAYYQGIPKHFLKYNTPTELAWPTFANLGEQLIETREIMAFQASDGTFGYVPRYAEYKFEHNRVAGEFRTTLDFWHLARKFDSVPQLNSVFIEAVPTTRVFAVEDTEVDHLYCHVYNKIKVIRALPKFGTPTF